MSKIRTPFLLEMIKIQNEDSFYIFVWMKDLNEVKNKVPDLEFLARQVVDGFIIGLHKSPFHGFSVEFAEHRLYNSGDNLRHVDWKVYGRSEKMFSKKYQEETNLRCCVAIDTSSSMYFESAEKRSKLTASVEAAACLIELLKRQMDAASLAFFDEEVYMLTKSGTSNKHKGSLFIELEKLRSGKVEHLKTTHAAQALHDLAERLHKRSLVVLFSDLLESAEDAEELITAIQHIRHNKHELIVFMVGDKNIEWDFNLKNRPLELKDMETGEVIKLHPESVSQQYQEALNQYIQWFEEQCGRMKVDFHLYDINDAPEEMLRIYLMKRSKMM